MVPLLIPKTLLLLLVASGEGRFLAYPPKLIMTPLLEPTLSTCLDTECISVAPTQLALTVGTILFTFRTALTLVAVLLTSVPIPDLTIGSLLNRLGHLSRLALQVRTRRRCRSYRRL